MHSVPFSAVYILLVSIQLVSCSCYSVHQLCLKIYPSKYQSFLSFRLVSSAPAVITAICVIRFTLIVAIDVKLIIQFQPLDWQLIYTTAVHEHNRMTHEQISVLCARTQPSTLNTRPSEKRNSSGDEIANVNFLYDNIVHALQSTADLCINSTTDRRGYVLLHRFTKFSEITQCNGHYAVQGHSRSLILVPIESPYATSY